MKKKIYINGKYYYFTGFFKSYDDAKKVGNYYYFKFGKLYLVRKLKSVDFDIDHRSYMYNKPRFVLYVEG